MWEERSRMDLLERVIDKTDKLMEDGRLLHSGGTVYAEVQRCEKALTLSPVIH